MAHLVFISPPFLGHLNPIAALARALVGRGHRATFVGIADAGPMLAQAGVEFRPVGQRSHPPGHLASIVGRMAGLRGFWGLPGVIRDVSAATDMLCRELPDAVHALGADMIVCDQTEAAGGLVAEHLGLPVVSVANALPLNREPAVPPPFTGWRYDPSTWGIERNRGGYRVSDLLMRSHGKVISDHAARWRLPPRSRIEDCVSPWAEISQTVAGFDFPRDELPATFHHCGPLRDRSRPISTDDISGHRPTAYASLGTLQGGRAGIFRAICAAAEQRRIGVVLAHGGRLTERQVASLPGQPEVHAFVDQPAVLARADFAVLNGGLNTVMDALAAGVPAIAVPIAFEQGAIAARLERAGAGLAVSRRFLTVGRIGRAMDRVRRTPGLHEAALRLRGEIAHAGGVSRAADIVETVFRTGGPVTRDAISGASVVGARAA